MISGVIQMNFPIKAEGDNVLAGPGNQVQVEIIKELWSVEDLCLLGPEEFLGRLF